MAADLTSHRNEKLFHFLLFTLTPEVLHGCRHCSFLDWRNYKISRLQMAVDVLCQLEKNVPMFKIIYVECFVLASS